MKALGLRHHVMNKPKLADTTHVHTTKLSVDGMSCGACVRHLTTALNRVTGVAHVDIDLAKNEAVVDHLLDRVTETGLIAAISDEGYHARVLASSSKHGSLISQPALARHSTGCCCG